MKGMETAWLARSEQLEVSSMLWIPWALLASRRDYSEDIELNDDEVENSPISCTHPVVAWGDSSEAL